MKIEKRTESLRIVRDQKKTPGVLFGKNIAPVSIQVDEAELHNCLSEFGLTQTFKVKLGKVTHQVYIKEVQKDIIKERHFLNFKLLKVAAGDTIKANVALYIVGKENIEERRFEIHNQSDTIQIEYLVGSGVSHIDVDVSKMVIGDSLYAKDLILPEGMDLLDDEEKLILSVQAITEMPEEEEISEEESELTEPEILKQKSEE